MSPIGRIFVIINLVLSAVFLGFAANNLASAQKYRTQFDTTTAELAEVRADLEAQLAQVTSERDEAVRQRTDMRNLKDDLEARNTGLDQDLAKAQDELNKFKADMGNIASQLEGMTSSLDDMKTQVAQANEARLAAVEARRAAEQVADAAKQAQAAAEDRANQLDDQLAQAERNIKSLGDQVQDLDTSLETAKGLGFDPGRGNAPQIDGAVLQYFSDLNLVHINRGTNDQVRRGYVFDIFANGQYKGQARVEVVNPGTCTAVVLNSVDGTQIQQGDRVSTRI